MKQLDTKRPSIDVPKKPEYMKTPHGIWPLCPNCGRHLVQKYDEVHDGWIFEGKCIICGQQIFDVQKEGW